MGWLSVQFEMRGHVPSSSPMLAVAKFILQRIPRRLFAARESSRQPYSAEVLCSNWVARPHEQPAAPGGTASPERLREAEAPTFLARIYACQRC